MAEVRATTKLDSRGFKAGTNEMKGSIAKLSGALGNLKGVMAGAFGIGALKSLVSETISFGSTITDLAKQSGLSTDQFQALELAALDAGVAQDKIRTAMSKLNVVMGQAKRGMKTYVDLFDQVGIKQEELANMDPAQVFERLAETVSTAERGSAEFGAALEILGTRSGAQLIEVFERINKEGLDGMIDRGKQAGKIMGEDLVNNLDKTADALEQLKRQTKVVTGKVIGFFDETFKNIADELAARKLGLSLGEFMEQRAIGQRKHAAAQEEKDKQAKVKRQAVATEKVTDKEISEAWRAAEEQMNAKDAAEKHAEKIWKDELKRIKTIENAEEKLAGIEGTAGTIGPADRLAAIGGTIGGAISPQMQIARQQLDLDKKRNDFIKSLPSDIAKELEAVGALL